MKHNSHLIEKLQLRLESVKQEKTKKWWEGYMRHVISFRGVNLSAIRDELKKWHTSEHIDSLSIDQQRRLAFDFFESEYAEDKLAGVLFVELYLQDLDWKMLLKETEDLFSKQLIYDWNVCDWYCIRILKPLIERNGMSCAKHISSWHSADYVWQARASLVAFCYLTMEKNYIPLFMKSASILIQRKERFAKTAVGWVLREHSKTDKNAVVDFVKRYRADFSTESINNALKYFSKEEKKKIKGT